MTMKWKKHKILGAGSFGTVYLAASVNSPASLVAVKSGQLDNSLTLQKEATFLKELRGKPNIIQCFGEDISLENDQKVYNLFLEYASGGTLLDLIKNNKGTIPESHIALYTFMLLRGICSIHERNIIHCDLKPENILVFPGPNGMSELKIADFGLAKTKWEDPKPTYRFGRAILCRGTPVYAAPESTIGGLHEQASDIWSLGCIILEMITGKPLWYCKTVQDLLRVAVCEKAKSKIPESLCDDGKDFLRRCLSRSACMRFTAKQLIDHPFIVNNMKVFDENLFSSKTTINPFGDEWISTFDLFETSSFEVQDDNDTKESDSKDFLYNTQNNPRYTRNQEIQYTSGERLVSSAEFEQALMDHFGHVTIEKVGTLKI